jgi:hypothetical protein
MWTAAQTITPTNEMVRVERNQRRACFILATECGRRRLTA